MDTAEAAPDDARAEPPVVDAPTIGVPRIPAQVGPARLPVPVPSLAVPDERPTPPPAVLATVPAAPSAGPAPVPSTGVSPSPAGFAPGVAGQLASYVYLLVDPRTGRPFYVGRGRNDRCFRHLAAVRSGDSAGGKFPMGERVRAIEAGGRTVRIDILRHGLTPAEAATVQEAVGEALGLAAGPAPSGQRRPATELDAALAKRAKFKRGHPVVLLRVGEAGSDASYEVARRGWRIARRYTDVDSPRSPRWAVIVAGDLVAAVFRIEGWEIERPRGPAGRPLAFGPGDRYSFVGRPDPDLEKRYGGRSVAAYTGPAATNPLTYVGCGPHAAPYPVDGEPRLR